MAEQVEPANCACGRKARVRIGSRKGECEVKCLRLTCWVGPIRKTRAGAVRAWNKKMERSKK